MPRATVDGQHFPVVPTVNGLPTATGAAYTFGERSINPHLVPRSWLARAQTPIRRIPVNHEPFRVYPTNMRAGGRLR